MPGPGTVTITWTPQSGGEPIQMEVAKFPGSGIAMGMYNYDDSIRDFARASFRYGLDRQYPAQSTLLQPAPRADMGRMEPPVETHHRLNSSLTNGRLDFTPPAE